MSTCWTIDQGQGDGRAALGAPWSRATVRTSGSVGPLVGPVRASRPGSTATVPPPAAVLPRHLAWGVVTRGQADAPVEEWATIWGRLVGPYALRGPLQIHLWIENGEYVADAPALNLHAFGADRDDALSNLRERIVEEYEFLRSEEGRLAPRMAAVYAALCRVLGEPVG